jgi:muramoyltetrapeptide carboxypeptidase LdcA involved in peptidoglycan recycling
VSVCKKLNNSIQIIAPQKYVSAALNIQRASCAALHSPLQHAVKVGFDKVFEENYFANMCVFSGAKRNRVAACFKQAGFGMSSTGCNG